MAETTAQRLADLILSIARERAMEISNLKLQKLLYYCQAWHIAALSSTLFPERIEAWIHGPVVPPVFGRFKEYRWRPINLANICSVDDLETGDHRWPIMDLVTDVLNAYGDLSGPQLEALTHREDPWKNARNGIPVDQASTELITFDAMRDFYSPLLVSLSE